MRRGPDDWEAAPRGGGEQRGRGRRPFRGRRRRGRPGYDADFGPRAQGGPFREGYDAEYGGHGRRWDDGVEGRGPGEAHWRRRWRRLREHPGPQGWRSRGRELFGRFKEPIIGLTVAGAALPLAREAQSPERPTRERASHARSAVQPRAPVEEDVAQRWAEADEAAVRDQTIEGAVVRYGIDPRLAASIYDAAVAEGVEPDMAFGLVNTESTFRERAVSHVGARGLTQLLPSTANWMVPGTGADELFHPDTNLRIGFKYLKYLLDKYSGNADLALTAYNRGPGTVDRILDRGGDPDNGYAGKVLRG